MKRNPHALVNKEFDVVIIGGGIFGAYAAWDAVLRGLSVALIERRDFCSGTSANSFKIVHGGIRYLQHADLMRLRASCHERTALLRIAPHLVLPLPIAIPTYRHGREGKAFLGSGMLLYDLLTLDRNWGIKDPARKIPLTCFLSREELLDLFPDIPKSGLTGAAVFCDGQFYNPTRLVLAFIQSATNAGAEVANYVEVTGLLHTESRIHGVVAHDVLTGESYSIRAKIVLNTAGPWAESFLRRVASVELRPAGIYSRDACFVVPRRFASSYALALQGRTRDPDAILGRSARHLFVVPWRQYTLIGVWHAVYNNDPDDLVLTEEDLESFIDELKWAYPALELSLGDVLMWNAGLVPFGENAPGAVHLRYGKRSRLIDHEQEHGLTGLVTLIGIRYTMARSDAAHAIDLIAKKLGKGRSRPATDELAIHGGQIESFEYFVKQAEADTDLPIDTVVMRALIHNHGSEYRQVLKLAQHDPTVATTLEKSTVLKAEVLNAVRDEMAVKLSDVVFRRTDLATGGNPGDHALEACGRIVAKELGWTSDKMEHELRKVRAHFPAFGRAPH